MSLADLGFSRLFSAHLARRWEEAFGIDQPVALEDLLSDEDAALYLRRASGADIRSGYHPRTVEQRAFGRWFAYFSRHPLPTHDGRNDLVVTTTKNHIYTLTKLPHSTTIAGR